MCTRVVAWAGTARRLLLSLIILTCRNSMSFLHRLSAKQLPTRISRRHSYLPPKLARGSRARPRETKTTQTLAKVTPWPTYPTVPRRQVCTRPPQLRYKQCLRSKMCIISITRKTLRVPPNLVAVVAALKAPEKRISISAAKEALAPPIAYNWGPVVQTIYLKAKKIIHLLRSRLFKSMSLSSILRQCNSHIFTSIKRRRAFKQSH